MWLGLVSVLLFQESVKRSGNPSANHEETTHAKPSLHIVSTPTLHGAIFFFLIILNTSTVYLITLHVQIIVLYQMSVNQGLCV